MLSCGFKHRMTACGCVVFRSGFNGIIFGFDVAVSSERALFGISSLTTNSWSATGAPPPPASLVPAEGYLPSSVSARANHLSALDHPRKFASYGYEINSAQLCRVNLQHVCSDEPDRSAEPGNQTVCRCKLGTTCMPTVLYRRVCYILKMISGYLFV